LTGGYAATSAQQVDELLNIPKLGIGLLYNPSLVEFLESDLDGLDYIEIIPDMFWTDRGHGQSPRYIDLESWVRALEWIASRWPIVGHNIGLSLGSADVFDEEHLDRLAGWVQRYRYPWHSDHLSFLRISGPDGHDHNAGLAVPVPYDEELLDLFINRIKRVRQKAPIPFLIENSVYFVDIPEQEMSEPEFLNRLSIGSGCGLLLDLHNLYTNSRNHNFDPLEFVNQLDLGRVVEIHIAGGSELAGMWTDSHAGPVSEPVWELLAYTVPKTANLAAITFEFHDSYYPLLKTEGIRQQLERARSSWNARRV